MLLLDRGSTTPPVFVKLRGELTEEGGGGGDGEESDGSGQPGRAAEELASAMRGLRAEVRAGVQRCVQLGVVGMRVGEVSCIVSDLGRGPGDEAGNLEDEWGDDQRCGQEREGQQVVQPSLSPGPSSSQDREERRRMIQVEIELIALNMRALTSDGGIIARIHADSAGKGQEGGGDAGVLATVAGAGGGREARPQAGDVAVVSYAVSYRGQVLLDQLEPHELRMGYACTFHDDHDDPAEMLDKVARTDIIATYHSSTCMARLP